MKTLLLALISVLSFSHFSFAQKVEVTEGARVTLADADIGTVADAVKNNLVTPTKVQAALVALIEKLKADRTAAEAKASDEKTKREAVVDAAEKDPAELAKKVAEAKETRKAAKLAALQAEINAKLAEKAKLEAEPASAAAAPR
jgi:preprotein translocase subunit SecF